MPISEANLVAAQTAGRENRTNIIPFPAARLRRRAEPLLTVVVPTFNERDNVETLVDRLISALAPADFEIIFVDDSTDDTPQIIMGLKHDVPIKLIHRDHWERAGGLTTAIVRGLRAARGEYVSVIDGDLQHPPEKLAEMLAEARRSGADVVVASRYRNGGSADGLPGVGRRVISLASKWLSKLLFYERLRDTSDPGSGFFLLRREVIEDVELRPVGYKMLTEILVRGRWSRLVEVPYRFRARSAGESKATFRQGALYLQHTLRVFIEVPGVARIWKFLLVGASGAAVNLGLLWLVASQLGAPRHIGWATGVEASIFSNFWLHRSFTWRDRQTRSAIEAFAQLGRYELSSLAGVITNLVAFSAASALNAPVLAAGVFGIGGGLATNFAGASRFAFRAARPATLPDLRTPALRPEPADPARSQPALPLRPEPALGNAVTDSRAA